VLKLRFSTIVGERSVARIQDAKLHKFFKKLWMVFFTAGFSDAPLLAFTFSIEQISKRACDSDLPCLSRVVDPILSAPDYATAVQAFATAKLTMRTRVASLQFEQELMKLLSDPIPQCSFSAIVANGAGSCPILRFPIQQDQSLVMALMVEEAESLDLSLSLHQAHLC
jgi:hypothetical protein